MALRYTPGWDDPECAGHGQDRRRGMPLVNLPQGGGNMQFRHILAPTDFSEYSKKAIACALEWARKFGAKLTLLHVVELPAYPVEGYVPPSLSATFLEDLERQASVDLAQLVPEAETAGIEVARVVAVGTPYRTIIDTAEAEHVDLIVMATAGRTGFSHLVLGSIAERVVRTATCPVLTIRPHE
jgi:nucleotide-binding universal stress UspA family protein